MKSVKTFISLPKFLFFSHVNLQNRVPNESTSRFLLNFRSSPNLHREAENPELNLTPPSCLILALVSSKKSQSGLEFCEKWPKSQIPTPVSSFTIFPPGNILTNPIDPVHIAVIGGTGIEHLPHFTKVASLAIDTPWGKPSSPISILQHPSPTSGKPIPIAFLSRHGIHHELAPHEVNSRANIAALRKIGVRTIVAFSAVGSLQEDIKPRDFVVPDQIIDRSKGVRPFTFFESGLVGHVGFGDPFDEGLAKVVRACGHSLEGEGVRLHDKGTVVCMGSSIPFHRFRTPLKH